MMTLPVYLIDTNVISELRKGARADPGVQAFWARAIKERAPLLLSVITLGELRRGVEHVRHRGDGEQAASLEAWLEGVAAEFADLILPIDAETAQIWGRLRAKHHEDAIDKQLAATALLHGLTVVTRDTGVFIRCGLPVHNPFSGS